MTLTHNNSTNSDASTYVPVRAVSMLDVGGDETSVISIKQPGVYVLNADLKGVAGKNGIKIDADNVTIELNGHSVLGCDGSHDGVVVAHIAAHVTVRNGFISGWGHDGVDLDNAIGCRVSSLAITGNKGFGLLLGEDAQVDGCTVCRNREAVLAGAPHCRG